RGSKRKSRSNAAPTSSPRSPRWTILRTWASSARSVRRPPHCRSSPSTSTDSTSARKHEVNAMPSPAAGRQTCFVVMGFGEKIDYQSSPQRVWDLNRTYEAIIEPAVTECGLECIRADKIIPSTVIDKPMYEQLLEADLVIADLSTSNANAIY